MRRVTLLVALASLAVLLTVGVVAANHPGTFSQPLTPAEIQEWNRQNAEHDAICAPLVPILTGANPFGIRCAEYTPPSH